MKHFPLVVVVKTGDVVRLVVVIPGPPGMLVVGCGAPASLVVGTPTMLVAVDASVLVVVAIEEPVSVVLGKADELWPQGNVIVLTRPFTKLVVEQNGPAPGMVENPPDPPVVVGGPAGAPDDGVAVLAEADGPAGTSEVEDALV